MAAAEERKPCGRKDEDETDQQAEGISV